MPTIDIPANKGRRFTAAATKMGMPGSWFGDMQFVTGAPSFGLFTPVAGEPGVFVVSKHPADAVNVIYSFTVRVDSTNGPDFTDLLSPTITVRFLAPEEILADALTVTAGDVVDL